MQSQRIRVPSAKAIANEALRTFDEDEILLGFNTSIERQPRRPPRVQPSSPASTPAAAANQSASKAKKPYKKQTKTSRTPSAPPTPPPKFRSILSEHRSARELRQNSKTALAPLLVREHASWEDDLPYPEGVPPLQPIVRQKADEEKAEISPYANGEIPPAPPEPEPELLEDYYSHPEFSPMPRINHAARVNLPENLTSLIELFEQFFPREQVEGFVTATNEYARQEIQRRQAEKDAEASAFNRRCAASRRSKYLLFKPMTIKEAYVFLGILIHMSFEKMSKLRDYWRAPRGPLDHASTVGRYMSLRRFQSLFRMFTVSPNSNEVAEPPRNRHKPSRAWKRSTKEADAGARREAEDLPSADNSQSMVGEPPFWNKVEPLASYIRDTSKRVYTPGSHVTIDEAMLAFRGRTMHTTKLKNKPIKEGYKNWLLAEHGYAWNWLWHSNEDGTEGSKNPRDSRIPEALPETQRLIMRLACTLPTNELDFTLYLDNLFTSVPLAQALKDAFIGMTGTTRKNSKGVPQWMLDLKQKNREFIWDSAIGSVCGGRKLSECKEGELPRNPDILVFLWQDNNSVIGKASEAFPIGLLSTTPTSAANGCLPLSIVCLTVHSIHLPTDVIERQAPQ